MTWQNEATLVEEIEIDLLLEGLYRRYGVDLRNYARGPLREIIRKCMLEEKVKTVSGFLEKVMHDADCLQVLLFALSTNGVPMFHDPRFYRAFRTRVVPLLRTHPFVRIWVAGCSTGEEVYSMAIMLEEEGIYQRSRIYATDHSREAVKMAKEGAFPLRSATEYTNNYLRAGGRRSLSDYYSESGERIVLKPALSQNVTFSEHNLATDGSFNEFQVVLCRNVMTHFNQDLQGRVHELIYDSLSRFGIVGLGKRESLKYSPREAYYETLDEENRLYRKAM